MTTKKAAPKKSAAKKVRATAAAALPTLPNGYGICVQRGSVTVTADNVPAKHVQAVALALVATLRNANTQADELTPDLGHVGGAVLDYSEGYHEEGRGIGFAP
jgi:hypothetical protein